MRPIIAPIDKRLLQMELKNAVKLKPTNRGGNELYVATHLDAPNIMLEIGRLREIAFRLAGGGTGHSVDVDSFDTDGNAYKQLIVWNPKDGEILGGYRYIVSPKEPKELATSELFSFDERFCLEYMPYMMELGRSFVAPNYQNVRRNAKSIFALDNLWDGIGGLICAYPEIKYLFGKVTMYPAYNKEARNILHYFLRKYFPDKDNLVVPICPLDLGIDDGKMEELFRGNSYQKDYKILSAALRDRDETIPPLINSYMALSPTMRTFGCAVNVEFGGVEETGILITIEDVYAAKKERHIIGHRPNKLNLRKLLTKPRRKRPIPIVTIST